MEQKITTNQKLQALFNDKITRFELCLDMCKNYIKPANNYDFVYQPESIILLTPFADEKYDSSSTLSVQTLTNNRLKLTRRFEAYSDFQCSLLPSQTVKSASLFMTVITPKDPVMLDSYLDKYLRDPPPLDKRSHEEDVWRFNKDLADTHYVLVKKVENITGVFNFFDCPLFMFNPFTSFSIEIEYENSPNYFKQGHILCKAFTFCQNLRNKMLRIGNYAEGDCFMTESWFDTMKRLNTR